MSSNRIAKTKLVSRVISFFTKRDLNKTPLESLTKVKIDSYLISLGLLSEHYGVRSSLAQAFWKRSHQIFVTCLQWFMLCKWMFCSFLVDNGYTTSAHLGDFTHFLSGKAFDYHFILTMWSMAGVCICHLFSMSRNHHRLNLFWLKPFELCKGSVKHQELRLEVEEASEFWQRVLVALWFSKLISRVVFLLFAGAYLYVTWWLMPKDQLDGWSYFWSVVTVLWLYYSFAIQMGAMAVFHMLCYYFIAKYRKLNDMVTELETNPKIDPMTIHQTIANYMNDHNAFAKDLSVYNKFWQYYLVIIFTIYVTIVCFYIELVLFVKMSLFVQILSLVHILAFFLFLIFIALSAGAVSEQMHESYGPLNAISQSNMPLVLKTQLQIYIQRIGGPTMGFSCWDLFTVTYDGFCQALLMVGSFFLLYMDVTQSEKNKYRKTVDAQQMASVIPQEI